LLEMVRASTAGLKTIKRWTHLCRKQSDKASTWATLYCVAALK